MIIIQYNFKYSKMPSYDEYLSMKTTKIGNNEFNYWIIKSLKGDSFLGISSNIDNILSMALSQQQQNQDLQKMLAQSTASNAKSNVDVENLKKQNAELTQQIAKMQIQNKKG